MSLFQNLPKDLTGKSMFQGIIQGALTLYSNGKLISAPLFSYGAFLIFLQVEDIANKSVWAVIGTIVIAIVSYLGIRINAKTRIEVKKIEVTTDADVSRQVAITQMFDRAMLEADRQRAHFTAELQHQREHFSSQLVEFRDHYERREKENREEFHARLGKAGDASDRCNKKLITLEVNLKNAGIVVSDTGEISLPIIYEKK